MSLNLTASAVEIYIISVNCQLAANKTRYCFTFLDVSAGDLYPRSTSDQYQGADISILCQ